MKQLALTLSLLLTVGSAPMVFAQSTGEIDALLATAARESGQPSYSPRTAVKFKTSDNVFLKSALAIDFTPRNATVTLPLYRGLAPNGASVYYIITEASDYATAQTLGINYAPKLRHITAMAGGQAVTLDNGLMKFRGVIDFAPIRQIVGGSPNPFPPLVAKPGAIADAEWSSAIVLPSGIILNAQVIANASGTHDRLKALDLIKRTVTLSLLDGMQDGKPLYYHLVTDVSAEVPAVLENGVYAPRLANILSFGQSRPSDRSALLGFSPTLNGPLEPGRGAEQGFASSIANNGIDPVNVFPIEPDNNNRSQDNNYSPLWDAHVNQWTAAAIQANKVRRINSFADLIALVQAGDVESAVINPPGPGNAFVAGLRPTKVVINCPVIAHPTVSQNAPVPL
ncbi:hypothetical protein [Candidatus Cyanaurora vandensis]|uniref:DUF7482 domain-containing protein n=1 Tax=Candidatus Cyanaurora vandensis TaxID=2714958 RepID=UPI00257EFA28|nr:hypothetical protein [Candidatus Cyanaurora vandensis]